MKKSFGARRVPKIIRDDDDEEDSNTASVVIKPQGSSKKGTKKGLTARSLPANTARLSIGDGDDQDEEADGPGPNIPSKRTIKPQRRIQRSNSDEEAEDTNKRYDDEHLRQLRKATFSNKRQESPPPAAAAIQKKVDVAAKFGADATADRSARSVIVGGRPLHIPSDAEIREKKARRARLALGERDDEDDHGGMVTGNHDMGDGFIFLDESGRHPDEGDDEGRLVREDEDIAEGFEEFLDDGQVAIGRKQEKEWNSKRKTDMATMIAEAQELTSSGEDDEGRSGSDIDDENGYNHYTERTSSKRYDEAQIRAGNFAASVSIHKPIPIIGPVLGTGEMTPPKVRDIPDLAKLVARLRDIQAGLEKEQAGRRERVLELEREKAEVDESERWVQSMMVQTGKSYARMVGADETIVTDEVKVDADAEGDADEDEIEGQNVDDDDKVQVGDSDSDSDSDYARPGLGAAPISGGVREQEDLSDIETATTSSRAGLGARSQRDLSDLDSTPSQEVEAKAKVKTPISGGLYRGFVSGGTTAGTGDAGGDV